MGWKDWKYTIMPAVITSILGFVFMFVRQYSYLKWSRQNIWYLMHDFNAVFLASISFIFFKQIYFSYVHKHNEIENLVNIKRPFLKVLLKFL